MGHGQSKSTSKSITDATSPPAPWQQRLASSCDGGVLLRHVVGLPTAVVPHIVVDDAVGPFVGGVRATLEEAAGASLGADIGIISHTADVVDFVRVSPNVERLTVGLQAPDPGSLIVQCEQLLFLTRLTALNLNGVAWATFASGSARPSLPPTLLDLAVQDISWAVLGDVLRASSVGPLLRRLGVQGGDGALQDCHSEERPCPALQSLQVLELDSLRYDTPTLRQSRAALLSFSSVTSLTLKTHYVGSDDTERDLSALPRLAELNVCGMLPMWHAQATTVVFNMVKNLDVALTRMPNMTDLTLHSCSQPPLAETWAELKHLVHVRGNCRFHPRALKHVAATIRTLQCTAASYPRPPTSVLCPFPVLTTFRPDGLYLSPPSFLDIPNVTDLFVSCPNTDADVVMAIAQHCPRLKVLTVLRSNATTDTLQAAMAVPNSPFAHLSRFTFLSNQPFVVNGLPAELRASLSCSDPSPVTKTVNVVDIVQRPS